MPICSLQWTLSRTSYHAPKVNNKCQHVDVEYLLSLRSKSRSTRFATASSSRVIIRLRQTVWTCVVAKWGHKNFWSLRHRSYGWGAIYPKKVKPYKLQSLHSHYFVDILDFAYLAAGFPGFRFLGRPLPGTSCQTRNATWWQHKNCLTVFIVCI